MPIIVLILSFFLTIPLASAEKSLQSMVAIPGAEGGTGFDGRIFSPKLKKALVPGGATGRFCLSIPLHKR